MRDTKTALLTKIDDSDRELATRLQKCKDLVTQYSTRSNFERTQETMATQIATLQSSIAILTSAAAASSVNTVAASSVAAFVTPIISASLEISDVIHELDLRVSKKFTIVLRCSPFFVPH